MNDQNQDSHIWKSYRKNRLVLVLLFLGWIPALGVSNFLRARLHLPLLFPTVVGALWLVAVIVQGWRLRLWPCPSCGKSFRGWSPLLPKRCYYCGRPRLRAKDEHGAGQPST
jgi:hypothetical protein